jgi:hypothetical protein
MMNDTELKKGILNAERQFSELALQVIETARKGDIPISDPERRQSGSSPLVEDLKMMHSHALLSFGNEQGVHFGPENWRVSDYTDTVYGSGSSVWRKPVEPWRMGTYERRACSPVVLVGLVRDHFDELLHSYHLNRVVAVPPEKADFAAWFREHTAVSRRETAVLGIEDVANNALSIMLTAAANYPDMDHTAVLDIHKKMINDYAAENGIKIPEWRVNSYLGQIYVCGRFNPAKLDDYAKRIRAAGTVSQLIADEFPAKPKEAVQ